MKTHILEVTESIIIYSLSGNQLFPKLSQIFPIFSTIYFKIKFHSHEFREKTPQHLLWRNFAATVDRFCTFQRFLDGSHLECQLTMTATAIQSIHAVENIRKKKLCNKNRQKQWCCYQNHRRQRKMMTNCDGMYSSKTIEWTCWPNILLATIIGEQFCHIKYKKKIIIAWHNLVRFQFNCAGTEKI